MGVIDVLYRVKQSEFTEKLREQSREDLVYVTDLTSCSHKRLMRIRYPLLSFRFEPSMLLGDLVHTGLQRLLTELDPSWRAEVEVSRVYRLNGVSYELRGRADLVRYRDGVPETVVEIKTGRDLQDNAPREHHVLQLKVYLELLGAREGYLLYVTPDRLVEFRFERGGVDVEALVRETVEDRARPRYDWECRYCPYRRICPYALADRRR